MNAKELFLGLASIVTMASCSQGISPQHAADHDTYRSRSNRRCPRITQVETQKKDLFTSPSSVVALPDAFAINLKSADYGTSPGPVVLLPAMR